MSALRRFIVIALVALGTTGQFASAASASSIPFRDTNAVGSIGLCDRSGDQITSGSISTTPFAWRAVSTFAAPAPYNNAWRTAILMAYQPQDGLLPSEWSGEQLTSSSRYTNPRYPMAAATASDSSLSAFIDDFPPRWHDLIELRIYLGTQNAPAYNAKYSALVIQVRENTWFALDSKPVNCHSGTSTSIETILLPTTTTTGTTGSSTTTSSSTTTVPNRGSNSTKSSNTTVWLIGALSLIVVIGGVVNWRSRRSARTVSPEEHEVSERT
jgi:hypothetical protein